MTELVNENSIKFYIDQIGDKLGVNLDDLKEHIIEFTNIQKLSFIKNTQEKLNKLLELDEKLKNISTDLDDTALYGEAKKNWDNMLVNVGKLQALSLINKTANCEQITQNIISAIDAKITAVNAVLDQNLQTGGNINSYKHKYLKYKSKYLRIKNNM